MRQPSVELFLSGGMLPVTASEIPHGSVLLAGGRPTPDREL